MTRFTVVWDDDVEVPFINAWIASDSGTRAVLTEIANWVDTSLAEDADIKGQLCPGSSARTIDVALRSSEAYVSVTYQVFPHDRQVRVIRFVFKST